MKIFNNFLKPLKVNKTAAIAFMTAASVLASGFCISTEAALTDSATVNTSVKADIWIVPSVNPSAPDFQSATVNWTKAGTYTSYKLQYSTSSTFTTFTNLTVTGLTKTISGLKSNTTYYFRVAPTTSPTGTWKTASVAIPAWTPVLMGTGWDSYGLIVSGDLNKDGKRDVDAVTLGSGVLYMYPGDGTGYVSSSARVQIGTGWSIYDNISGAGDWNEDGREDILAIDASGVLWLYKANATWSSNPYGTRVQIGVGWGSLWGVQGAGDVTGDGHPDIVGVDTNNVLRIYPGNGSGGFGSVIYTTTSFANYYALTPIGDLNKDGNNDLIGMDTNGQMWFFAGNGVATTSAFAAPVKIPNFVLDINSAPFGTGDMDRDGYPDISEVTFDGYLRFWEGSDIAKALGF